MSLKQDIVIKNQFTVNRNGVATKSATPRFYILQYMARPQATETLSPVQYRGIEDFQLRYMARQSATDIPMSSDEFLYVNKKNERKSGVAFSENNISLSHKDLKVKAKEIQTAFNEGHTVQEIVLSFTEEFLKRNDVVDTAFRLSGPGSYRRQIDQLKLRRAITDGLLLMAREEGYKKPVFTAVIQVDTKHVHCHIAMCDLSFSAERLTQDGEEVGKLSEKAKVSLRRGIDLSLREMKPQHSFRQQLEYEKKNIISFIKKLSNLSIKQSSKLQLILSSLPPDKRLWRATSNAKVMNRPNELARMFFDDVFSEYPVESRYADFKKALDSYIVQKIDEGQLSSADISDFEDNIYNTFYNRIINELYTILKNYNGEKVIMTPSINLEIRDTEELLPKVESNDDSVSFEIRLRSYKSRLNYYKQSSKVLHRYLEDYLNSPRNQEAVVVLNFYLNELNYHRNLLKKYSYFLNYNKPLSDHVIDKVNDLYSDYLYNKHMFDNYSILLNDPPVEFSELPPDEKDRVIFENYNIDHRSWFYDKSMREQLLEEHRYLFTLYSLSKESYEYFCENHDILIYYDEVMDELLSYDDSSDVTEELFANVKALDLHRLSFDFPDGIDVSNNNVVAFKNAMLKRRSCYNDAMQYFIATEQSIKPFNFIKNDIEAMEKFYADEFNITHQIPPFEFEPEPEMERSLAPRIEESPNEIETAKEILQSVNIFELDQELQSAERQEQTV